MRRLVFLLAIAAPAGRMIGGGIPAPPDFAARLRALAAVETVLDRHRSITPGAAGDRRSFRSHVPDAALARRVRAMAAASVEFERRNGVVITPALLQAELERMSRDSRDPALLRELFGALGDDPALIAESLAWQTLVERGTMPDAGRAFTGYRLPAVVEIPPGCDEWNRPSGLSSGAPQARYGHSAVWTGAEMIVWGGYTFTTQGLLLNSGGRYRPATDSWAPTATAADVPLPRYRHTAVWTGTEMIVWGGFEGTTVLGDGGRYDPAADAWLPVAVDAGSPEPRQYHAAVWSGAEMIVWGGAGADAEALGDGGRYDPAADEWHAIPAGVDTPPPRESLAAVWTGAEMIVWGGGSEDGPEATGGRYNPSLDLWRPTAEAGAPEARFLPTAVWNGAEMIAWGGQDAAYLPMNSGGRYDPAADRWLPVTEAAATPAARYGQSAVWTGGEMILWGGSAVGDYLQSGGRYLPAADAWSATAISAQTPDARYLHAGVWTGADLIVWGGFQDLVTEIYYGDGAFYHSGSALSPGNSLRAGKTGGLRLDWAAVSGAAGYRVLRCTPGGTPCMPATQISAPTLNAYGEGEDGLSHFYAVEARNSCGSTP